MRTKRFPHLLKFPMKFLVVLLALYIRWDIARRTFRYTECEFFFCSQSTSHSHSLIQSSTRDKGTHTHTWFVIGTKSFEHVNMAHRSHMKNTLSKMASHFTYSFPCNIETHKHMLSVEQSFTPKHILNGDATEIRLQFYILYWYICGSKQSYNSIRNLNLSFTRSNIFYQHLCFICVN